jgi:6-pyruvoyltetrahydropterin/6-carboxytetrahydropterin synthase
VMTIEIGGGPFVFCAAHAGLHDGQFEPLHGHTFTVTLRLHGALDATGMLTDFQPVKKALAQAIAPLRRRTLMPAQPSGGTCQSGGGQVVIECGGKRYSLPAQDVALLPVTNTTTEALAAHLLSEVLPCLHGVRAVERVELTLAEAPDTAATAAADLATGHGTTTSSNGAGTGPDDR